MANKEKESDAEGEKPEGEGADAAPKKGFRKFLSKKILMIAVPALFTFAGLMAIDAVCWALLNPQGTLFGDELEPKRSN